MIHFQGLVVVLTLVVASCWATSDKHSGEGLDAAGYPLNITGILRISEGKTKSSIIEQRSVDCLHKGRPTESCNIAGGFCIGKREVCPGAVESLGATVAKACRRPGCKCCMPHELPDCSPRRSCSSADGYCVKDEADCTGVIDQLGCRGAGCKCCLPSSYDLPWVYFDDEAFVPFPEDPMNWYNAQWLCRSYGLNLYHPHNIINVTKYLDENTSADWYWFGAKGDMLNQIWFDGTGLSYDDPWYYFTTDPWEYYNNGTNDCLATIAWNDQWVNETVLFAGIDSCSDRTDINPVCG